MLVISLKDARDLALRRQLDFSAVAGDERATLRRVIERLGYVQIDTISVVARAHHHVLWSRLPAYERPLLKALEEEDRAIFEYWAHAASYLPIADYRFTLPRKAEFLSGEAHWFKKDEKLVSYVFDRIRTEGPLMSKDFVNPQKKKGVGDGMDWTINPVNLALRQLFMEGRVMVAYRRGFQKVYDLPERVLPPEVDLQMPSRSEYLQYLIERDIRAHGIIRARETGYLLKNTGAEIKTLLSKLVEAGTLAAVRVEGQGPEPFFLRPEWLENLSGKNYPTGLYILSPFDNIVIQRKRLEALFGFAYTLECYVPAAKRKFGYFGLPILWEGAFAGQIDLKADRRNRRLLIQNLEIMEGTKDPERLLVVLSEELKRYASFNACDSVFCSSRIRKLWPALKGFLKE